MKKTIMSMVLAGLVLASTNCASIVSKSTYPLNISSNPSATVSVTDHNGMEIFRGETPTIVSLKSGAGFFKRASYQVKFTKDGYNDKVVPVNFKTDGWYWGNILIGGVLGMLIVDPATGAMYKLETEFISETLTRTEAVADQPMLKIMGIDEVPESWKAKMEKLN